MSFALAAAATALLRGSGEQSPDSTGAARVVIEPVKKLPLIAPWEITVAAAVLGRARSITVLHRGAASPAGSLRTVRVPAAQQLKPAEAKAARGLLARWRAADGDRTRRFQAVVEFLDRSPTALGPTRGLSPAGARAAESARLLAAVQGGCLKREMIEPRAVSASMGKSGDGFGLGRHPAHARYVGARNDENVRQIGVVGRGNRRLAVAVVAHAPRDQIPPRAAREQMLTKVAKWIDDNVHPTDSYAPDC